MISWRLECNGALCLVLLLLFLFITCGIFEVVSLSRGQQIRSHLRRTASESSCVGQQISMHVKVKARVIRSQQLLTIVTSSRSPRLGRVEAIPLDAPFAVIDALG